MENFQFATNDDAKNLYSAAVIAFGIQDFFGEKDSLYAAKAIAGKLKTIILKYEELENFCEDIFILELNHLVNEYSVSEQAIKLYGNPKLKENWVLVFVKVIKESVN